MTRFRILLTVVASAAAAPAYAASGGGGGSLPSASAPQYDPAAEYRAGLDALKADDFKKAERHLARVVSAAPRDANSHYLLGLARAGGNNLKGALKAYEKAVKLDSNLVLARQNLGITYAKLGDSAKATEQLDELKRRQAACGTCAQAAQIGAAVNAVSAALGGGKQALQPVREGLLFAGAEAGDAAYIAAVSLINAGRFADAIEQLDTARQSFGPHPDVLTYLGFAHRKLGRFDVAEAYYRQALAAAPGHLGATEYFGELKVERGDIAGARAMLARLDALCSFGCAEAEELRRWIDAARPS
jgi:tetratricopeptide (TPR) repeat protein